MGPIGGWGEVGMLSPELDALLDCKEARCPPLSILPRKHTMRAQLVSKAYLVSSLFISCGLIVENAEISI
jgi:hypothetical protein